MKAIFQKIYNIIMYTSIFLALLGIYCKVTKSVIESEYIIHSFIIGIIISTIILLILRHLFLQFQKNL